MLYGSSILAPLIDINGDYVSLGEIVAAAHTDSGLSETEWNALPCLDREARLARKIYEMRGEEG